MPSLHSLCVFCGSSPDVDDVYFTAAREVGRVIASQGRRLVYGGGRIGLMGALADAATAAGGEVIGVIPRSLLDKEVGHQGLSRLHVVASMHDRKALMAELSDGFIALPGGIGTLEEFFEIWTWAQLGLHHKPFGLLNVAGFFDPLLAFLDELADHRFLRREHRGMLHTRPITGDLIRAMTEHQPIDVWKWLSEAES
ncbi:MAG: TIGR00730 family Rossman fold protein [Planctomycetes bacterium]|nr:TIGR00730 family Rossman fold protein [Planctomycetota bacterium]